MVNKVGYFVIVTSKKMDAAEALSIYRDRDAVEKTFRMEKSYLGFDVFRVHDTEKLESKVFISFVALILRNEIYQALKPMYKKNRKDNTVPKVIREYERLGITKLSDNKYHVRYSLTSRQKKILGAVGVTEKDYMDKINKIVGNKEPAVKKISLKLPVFVIPITTKLITVPNNKNIIPEINPKIYFGLTSNLVTLL